MSDYDFLDAVEINREVHISCPLIDYPFPLDNFQKQAHYYIKKVKIYW